MAGKDAIKIKNRLKGMENKSVNNIAKKLANSLLLWHCTLKENAEAISREGFRLGPGSKRWSQREKTIYFFHSVAFFLDMVTEQDDKSKFDCFFCAVDKDSCVLGKDYTHDMVNVFTFHTPIPKDAIIIRFDATNVNSRDDLKPIFEKEFNCDIGEVLSETCLDKNIPWNQVVNIASTLRALDQAAYHNRKITNRLIYEELKETDIRKQGQLFSIFLESSEKFQRLFLNLYYGEYASPNFARALMVAGAKFVCPARILSLHDPTVNAPNYSGNSENKEDEESVFKLLAEFLPKLEREKVIFGAIEMASMWKFPGDNKDLTIVENWISQQGQLAEESAFYFIHFGGDSFPQRNGNASINMAAAALRGTGQDYFEQLSKMTETDYPGTLFGLMEVFGALKETRAIPFLSLCLKDKRKQFREAAIYSLGQINTTEAIDLVNKAANDPAKSVQRAVKFVLKSNKG